MSESGYKRYWTRIGKSIAKGEKITFSELYAIYENLDISHLKPDYLPGDNTILGTASKRKEAIFDLIKKLFNTNPNGWLVFEGSQHREACRKCGIEDTGGKDKITDVVSTEILIRIIATAKLVYENRNNHTLRIEAVLALNLVLAEACAKGRTRMIFDNGQSIYGILRNSGVVIGTAGGKYLPYPEDTLPYLFTLLHKGCVQKDAYYK